jgi:hypothetical protein
MGWSSRGRPRIFWTPGVTRIQARAPWSAKARSIQGATPAAVFGPSSLLRPVHWGPFWGISGPSVCSMGEAALHSSQTNIDMASGLVGIDGAARIPGTITRCCLFWLASQADCTYVGVVCTYLGRYLCKGACQGSAHEGAVASAL